jgi:hypothetical protein
MFLWLSVMTHPAYAACAPGSCQPALWRHLLVFAYALAIAVSAMSTMIIRTLVENVPPSGTLISCIP